jgi:hypothetical protein
MSLRSKPLSSFAFVSVFLHLMQRAQRVVASPLLKESLAASNQQLALVLQPLNDCIK